MILRDLIGDFWKFRFLAVFSHFWAENVTILRTRRDFNPPLKIAYTKSFAYAICVRLRDLRSLNPWLFSTYLAHFRLQWPFSQNLQNFSNFDHSGPNKLKFGLGSLWGSFKKMPYTKFLIFFAILHPKKCWIGKNRQKTVFFRLSEAEKSRQIKKN